MNTKDINDAVTRELSHEFSPTSFVGLEVMLLRISWDNTIAYANSALANYLNSKKEDLVGQPLAILNKFFPAEALDSLCAAAPGSDKIKIINDYKGRTFEIKVATQGSFRDIVIQDHIQDDKFYSYVSRYFPPDMGEITESDITTFKYPERRYMSVSFTDLRGFTELSETLSPEEVREMVNAYLDVVIGAVQDNHASVDKVIGDSVMVLYGAPRYHQDYALRAIKTACDQLERLRLLQHEFRKAGRPMPQCGIGINTGEMVVGNIGPAKRQDYTVLGSSVNIAARLCAVAQPSEILMTESSLWAALQSMPEDWDAMESTLEQKLELPYTVGRGNEFSSLPEELDRKVIAIGPNMNGDINKAHYYFFYLYLFRAKGIEEPFPVLSVVSADDQEKTLTLNDNFISHVKTEKIFGKYRMHEVIGRGGMGEVWRASDQFGNVVALKMLLAGHSASDDQIRRFKQEARILSKLPHRNICRIHEVGEYDGNSYLAMEYIDGLPLDQVLAYTESGTEILPEDSLSNVLTHMKAKLSQKIEGIEGELIRTTFVAAPVSVRRTLPVSQVLTILFHVCDALQYAHQHGVLHRDIKPGNIMLRSDGDPVVMDFGLAKFEKDIDGGNSFVSAGVHSLTGMALGTLDYMAPEQALSSKDVDERADVYSLGAVLYRLLTGAPHFFVTGHLINDAQNLQTHEPVSLSILIKTLDYDLEIITLKALRADPKERYQSIAALKNDLERYQRGEVIHARPVTLKEVLGKWIKRNHSLFYSVTGATVSIFLILALSVFLLNSRRLEAIRLKEVSQKNENLARANEKTALEASSQAFAAKNQLLFEQAENAALLEKYQAERIARGDAEIKLTAREKEKLERSVLNNASEVKKQPLSASVLLKNVKAELGNKRWALALAAVEAELDLDPNNPEFLLLKARLEIAAFQLNDAIDTLIHAKKQPAFNPATTLFLETQTKLFYEVAKETSSLEQDRDLQKALARTLKQSPILEDRWVGEYLEAQKPY